MGLMIRILGLDAGLTTAWAAFQLDGVRLHLGSYGCERFPGKPHGNAGREQVYRWAKQLLEPFALADEVASDNELAGANLLTNVPALGAFDACREFARARGRIAKGKRVSGEYPRWVYLNQCAALANAFTPSGVERFRCGLPEYRAMLSALTMLPLDDTKGGRRHILDAIAAGIAHAHRVHYWHPTGWQDPKLTRRKAETAAWLKACSR
jgi:hypothetical protein